MAGEVPFNQQGAWVSPALPGPTVGGGGVATVVFSTQIAASPARCLEVGLDSARYPAWNKFIRNAIIEESANPAVVDTLDVSLKFLGEGGGNWLQNAERTQDFIESADGTGTDYFNKETFSGPLSYLIKPFVGTKLINALELWKDGLKAEAEKNT
ncbi:uncharacterized protein B0I36DRAFT_387587 [Microdochium trichocladiopsis]|uniref:Uncharacterized protein n=1 Tax=Microdochium trichocladiopsis TaxID=1682393 RepID=A0A9P8XV23_9PEZI|nr:uncharacterized protein B0I36DRAFT_387587 [Microdochium trichocladiopsis]KAH7020718.1 hypothetical protein B0I36DRAFT_387587 [Microdochium trichocladiopsis]